MIRRCAVVGAGYMGGGIAQLLALSGAEVYLADVSSKAAAASYDRLVSESADFVAEGLFPPGSMETIRANLRVAGSLRAAAQASEFIEEAVPEDLELKREILSSISSATDAIIGTNTSTISIGTLASAVARPERFVGVHFGNPAPFIPGVEVIPHAGTSKRVLGVVEALLIAIGKTPVRVRDVTGFVLNRLQYALFSEAARLVVDGVASPQDIDTVVRTTLGFRLSFFGPFAVADMAGLDVYASCYAYLHDAFPDRFTAPEALLELVRLGRLGTKSGGGFFKTSPDYSHQLGDYRNKAYVAMQRLLHDLGPPPRQPHQDTIGTD